jgi:hypothetical protein
MSINAFTLHWFGTLCKKGVFANGKRLLELGPQDLNTAITAEVLRKVAHDLHDAACEPLLREILRTHMSKEVYQLFGVSDYKSLDYFDSRADYSFDLNLVCTPLDKFDIITNFGTAEHLFNIAASFESIHNMLPVSGVSLHILPAFGDINHGFYNIHPILYLKMAQANHYEIVDFTYADNVNVRAMTIIDNPEVATDFGKLPLQLSDMQNMQDFKQKVFANFLLNSCSKATAKYSAQCNGNVFDYCYVALRKTNSDAFIFPSQY